MELPRIEFCQLVPDKAVEDAVGGKPTSDSSYGNGDEVEVTGVGNDVVHEIGCAWTGENGSTARAWVFARPVDDRLRPIGDRLGREDRGMPHDRRAAVRHAGRDPALPAARRRSSDVRHAGLFGQTWLTCELATTDTTREVLRDRADQWCSEVANALNTAR